MSSIARRLETDLPEKPRKDLPDNTQEIIDAERRRFGTMRSSATCAEKVLDPTILGRQTT